MNVLVIAAHPDDEMLGCGATLRKLANAGHRIYTCVLCSQADARHARPELTRFREVTRKAEDIIGIGDSLKYDFPNIRFNTVPHIDIVQAIETAIVRFRPEWV